MGCPPCSVDLKVRVSFRGGGKSEAETAMLILSLQLLYSTWWACSLCLVNQERHGNKTFTIKHELPEGAAVHKNLHDPEGRMLAGKTDHK